MIFYTVNFNPSWDYFGAWVQDLLVNRMKVTVEQVKVMGKYTFLAVMATHTDQQRILAKTPLFFKEDDDDLAMED